MKCMVTVALGGSRKRGEGGTVHRCPRLELLLSPVYDDAGHKFPLVDVTERVGLEGVAV